MPKLTPTEQATLDALRQGSGNVHELTERTGRSRSGTDRALATLAKAALIVKVDTGGDPADGTPTRWQLPDAAPATDEPTDAAQADSTTDDDAQPHDQFTGTHDVATPPTDGLDDGQLQDDDPDREQPGDQQPQDDGPAGQPIAEGLEEEQPDGLESEHVDPDGQQPDGQPEHQAPEESGTAQPHAGDEPEGDGKPPAEREQPKLCRGCQAQMPKICPCCWQKTPAYCGTCRKGMPQTHRGEPGEPLILSNGLPKLRPGELEDLVLKVMQDNPVPNHVGVTGWTGSRVAVFLPGRSTGAINNALEKLARTGKAELIGDKPMRFTLPTPTEPTGTGPEQSRDVEPNTDTALDADQNSDSDTDTAETSGEVPEGVAGTSLANATA